jgi:hypothetical protein
MGSDDVEKDFPHPELTPHAEVTPTHLTLKTLHCKLNANAAAIRSNHGGGQHGLLSLVVPPATYATFPNTVPFVAPANPGPEPVHPAGATGPAIAEINRSYLARLDEFNTYDSTDKALKKLLIKAIPKTYIDYLSDETLGYATCTTLNLLTHLDTTYGTQPTLPTTSK